MLSGDKVVPRPVRERDLAAFIEAELSYQLYGTEHAGHRYTTEAVGLLVDYLIAAKKVNRISLVIVPDNTASGRDTTTPSAILNECGQIRPYSERCAQLPTARRKGVSWDGPFGYRRHCHRRRIPDLDQGAPVYHLSSLQRHEQT
jgi:Acetyltransferase (GNAT) domain